MKIHEVSIKSHFPLAAGIDEYAEEIGRWDIFNYILSALGDFDE